MSRRSWRGDGRPLPAQFAGLSGTIGVALTTPRARRTVGLTWRTDHALAPPAARLLAFIENAAPSGVEPQPGVA